MASGGRGGGVWYVAGPGVEVPQKDREELDKHAKILYEWVTGTQSRIRMLMSWQAAGGLSYVASVHHRATGCFLECGNSKHKGAAAKSVSMEDFQRCIRARHQIGDDGIHQEGGGVAGGGKKGDFE